MIQKDLLFSKRSDDKIENREDKFVVQIDSKYTYRISLKYFYDLGKINFSTKVDLKICCTLETEMKRFLWSTTKVINI